MLYEVITDSGGHDALVRGNIVQMKFPVGYAGGKPVRSHKTGERLNLFLSKIFQYFSPFFIITACFAADGELSG